MIEPDLTGDVRYPTINVKLTEQNGNAFVIMGLVTQSLRRAGVTPEEVKKYQEEAMKGDYDDLLITSMKWVNVE